MNAKTIVIIGLVVIFALGLFMWKSLTPGQVDGFAKCLKDKGAVFYGAFWCPHCQNQKRMFGNSAQYLNYVECSTADGRGQLPICTDKKVESYPTWEFADGSRLTGEVAFSKLAEKTGCAVDAK